MIIMSTTSESPRWMDLHSTELPGIRCLHAFDDKLLAVTLACEVRLIQGGQILGEWTLLSDQEKSSALERVRSVSLLPDHSGFYAAAGTSVWKIYFDDPEPYWVKRLKETFGFLHNSPYTAVALDNGRVWTSADTGDIFLVEGNGALLKRRSDNHSPHHAFRTPDGIVGADGTAICLWDTESLKRIQTLPQDGHIFNLVNRPGSSLAAAKVDGEVLVWDVPAGKLVSRIVVSPGLGVFAWNPQTDGIAVGVDQGIEVWSASGVLLSKHLADDVRYLSAGFSADGRSLYIGCDDGSIRMVAC